MPSSNCCFLICIQVSQEAGQVVWYSHLFQKFPQEMPGVTGKFVLGVRNETGKRLIEFCEKKALVIANSFFQQHNTRRLYMWTWTYGQYRYQIDYILCGWRWRSSMSVGSAAQSCPTVQPHEPQHTRLPCPSPIPGVHPNQCPSSQWCHPTISSSVVPFSSCLQSFPASGSFPTSLFFTSGGQSIGVSASGSVLPMNIQDLFPLGLTGWISLQSKDSQESSPPPQFKTINYLVLSFLYGPTLISIHTWLLEKP